ncbi:sulfite exporter TauE/SafE family protein [Methylomarinum sp. Ch1-1]|uniref:Sulfite exporter TauE/SafE family protein n=1 Tax=Methylomarinum roseum TaxID=3067653 RepID=A0AAU7NWN2_9GAMM|nr:sulfite exporter TauE/SafE family protein [Methylomarinum sp. Ch1-1]MDP4522546.1 sulfite exporter TauE/SafE family protein [Methylomarinum sp. Ch1-1]
MMTTTHLIIEGMHCSGCEQAIESAVSSLPGVRQIHISYVAGSADIEFDDDLIDEQAIRLSIIDKGYEIQCRSMAKPRRWLRPLIFIVLLLAVGGVAFWGKSQMPALLPQVNAQMSHAMLFGIGFLTGFHCIGMCGSFIVSYADQSMSKIRALLTHLAYGFGKTASYSAIGAAFGLLGAAITITPHMRGVAALAAGIFLLLFGLKMLDLMPWLRHFSLRLPRRFVRGVNSSIRTQRSPLVIGVLTGFLLGCGPLQAMYIMAAGTGSPQEGATLLFFFGLGTLAPLLSFGFFANFLSRHMVHELVRVSGVLVIIMGLMMTNRGLKMTRSGYDFASLQTQIQQKIDSIDQKE